MRIITQQNLHEALFLHPYDNTTYCAKMSIVSLAADHRQLIGYWEAPEGEVDIEYGENVEYNLVLEGELELERTDGTCETAKQGDIIECGGKSDRHIIFRVKKAVKTLFIVYPLTEADAAHVLNMQHA